MMRSRFSIGWWKVLAIAAILVSGLLVIFAFDPAHSNVFPPCPFKTLTGFYCPGCGSLRAVHQILHGHFFAALRLNPMMVVFSCAMVLIFIALRLKGKNAERLRRVLSGAWIGWIVFVLIVVYWLCRNIPSYPFTLLAPG
jgi:cytochrome bd-type quinol oxidase subunit 2